MPFHSGDYLHSISDEKRKQLFSTHISLGYHPETHDELLLPENDRYAGMYVLGVMGVGKSGFLENLIYADIEAGNAVIVVDPHGDLTTNCIAALPAHRLPQTYIIDMEDEAYPVGMNVFATGTLDTSIAQAQAVDRIMHVFEVLWEDVLSQQNLPRYVRGATLVLLANPGSTLVDMYNFLLDSSVRSAMLKSVTDRTVLQFWQQYDDLKPDTRLQKVQPLINRLESLFMGRSLVRNIVGQRRTTIDFRTAAEEKDIIFMRLPIKTVAQDARLIGTIAIAQLYAAIFSFANIPEAKRPGVSIYVDECQHFSTTDFAELFTEARKYGCRIILAHQYRNQLPSFLQASTMTARTKVCFQTTPEDGREMAYLFPAQEEIVRPEDISPHPVEHLLTYGTDDYHGQVLIEDYLRPLQAHKRGNRVEIDHFSYDWISNRRMDNPRVSDPTPYLDNLFYQVMRTGNANLPIPANAVIGFANCAQDFFAQVRGRSDNDALFKPGVHLPAALVAEGADGMPRWTRPPEGGMEQLYHFLFHLRMTMFYLAEEPIGKKTPPSTSAVGHMLSSLPRRAAFVRSAEDVGVIYTHDTPPRVSPPELQKRARLILAQTRQKYCHPRTEVEQALLHTGGVQPDTTVQPNAPSSTAQPNRWEEV